MERGVGRRRGVPSRRGRRALAAIRARRGRVASRDARPQGADPLDVADVPRGRGLPLPPSPDPRCGLRVAAEGDARGAARALRRLARRRTTSSSATRSSATTSSRRIATARSSTPAIRRSRPAARAAGISARQGSGAWTAATTTRAAAAPAVRRALLPVGTTSAARARVGSRVRAWEAGELDEASAVLDAAREPATRRSVRMARVVEATIDILTVGDSSSADGARGGEEARAVLEAAMTTKARALLVERGGSSRGSAAGRRDAGRLRARARALARAEDRVRDATTSAAGSGGATSSDPTPVGEAIERSRRSDGSGARSCREAGATSALGTLSRCSGDVDAGRELARRGRETFRRRRARADGRRHAMRAAWIEQRAGDSTRGGGVLRSGLEELERLGDRSPSRRSPLSSRTVSTARVDSTRPRSCARACARRPPAGRSLNFVYAGRDSRPACLHARASRGGRERWHVAALELAETTDFFYVRRTSSLLLAEVAVAGRARPRRRLRARGRGDRALRGQGRRHRAPPALRERLAALGVEVAVIAVAGRC